MNQSGKVALGGIVTALSVVCMLLTGLIPMGTFALPGLAGLFLVVIVIELGRKWAWMVYFAVSVLSILFAADKEAALLFVLFLGYYPILKAVLERIRAKWLQIVFKLLIFNAAMVACYFLALAVLQVPADSFELFGVSIPGLLLLLGNGVFLLYDYALTGLVATYVSRLQKHVRHMLRR